MSTLSQHALEMLKKTGAIVPCPVHTDVWMDNLDVGANEEARVMLLSEVSDGAVTASEPEIDKAIADVLADHSDECGYCSSNMMD